jgi:hypothetical protein
MWDMSDFGLSAGFIGAARRTKIPTPPKGLTPDARALWRAILAERNLSASELEILRQAVKVLATITRAEAVIDAADSEFPESKRGLLRNHPAAIVRDRNRPILKGLLIQLQRKEPT